MGSVRRMLALAGSLPEGVAEVLRQRREALEAEQDRQLIQAALDDFAITPEDIQADLDFGRGESE